MFHPEQPYDLPLLPPADVVQNTPMLMNLYMEALQHISKLDGALKEMDTAHALFPFLALQEPVDSSQIEAIYTTVESVLEDTVKPKQERSASNKEVIHYKEALTAGHHSMKEYNLSSRTIKAIHKALNVASGEPGHFRQQQNYLMRENHNEKITIYTPPLASQLPQLLSNWENFVHNDQTFFPLLKIAISHYQFEAIHPFADGNGRTGRILMVLQLVLEGLLEFPYIFISDYINRRSEEYKKLLLNITQHNQWIPFLEFLLKGFSIQAQKTQKALSSLKNERKSLKKQLYEKQSFGISKRNMAAVIDHIFKHPITNAQHMAKETKIHSQTCSKYLAAMSDGGLLTMNKSGTYKFYRNIKALNALKASLSDEL